MRETKFDMLSPRARRACTAILTLGGVAATSSALFAGALPLPPLLDPAGQQPPTPLPPPPSGLIEPLPPQTDPTPLPPPTLEVPIELVQLGLTGQMPLMPQDLSSANAAGVGDPNDDTSIDSGPTEDRASPQNTPSTTATDFQAPTPLAGTRPQQDGVDPGRPAVSPDPAPDSQPGSNQIPPPSLPQAGDLLGNPGFKCQGPVSIIDPDSGQEGIGYVCTNGFETYALWDVDGNGSFDYIYCAFGSEFWVRYFACDADGDGDWDFIYCNEFAFDIIIGCDWTYIFADFDQDSNAEYVWCNFATPGDQRWEYLLCDANADGLYEYAWCDAPSSPLDPWWDYWFCDANGDGQFEYTACNVINPNEWWDSIWCDIDGDGVPEVVWRAGIGGPGEPDFWEYLWYDSNGDGYYNYLWCNGVDFDQFWDYFWCDEDSDGIDEYVFCNGSIGGTRWEYIWCRAPGALGWHYVYRDIDGDGVVDYMWCDPDGNGVFNYSWCDQGSDPFWDYVWCDQDEDGREDYAWCNLDNDAYWDYVFCDELAPGSGEYRYIFCNDVAGHTGSWRTIFCRNPIEGIAVAIWYDLDGDGLVDEVFVDDGVAPCPYDCAPPPDGQVNVIDLLHLLATWGGPGSCDGNGDGVISINDLLEMLAAWGACP